MWLLKYLTKKDAKGDSHLPLPADVSNASSLTEIERFVLHMGLRNYLALAGTHVHPPNLELYIHEIIVHNCLFHMSP